MTVSNDFTPQDFFQLAKDATNHAVDLKIKLATAGIVEDVEQESDPAIR